MKIGILAKIQNSKEAKNAGWLIGGKIIQMILALVVGVISARYLGPDNYGLVSYGNSYVAFFMAFCTLGINSVIVKELLDNPHEEGVILGSSVALRLLSSFASSLMIVGIVAIMDHGEAVTIAVVALCSVSLVFHAFDTLQYWFQARYQSKTTAFVVLIAYVLSSSYKIVLLIAGSSVQWFAFASSVDYIAMAVLLLGAYKRQHGEKLGFSTPVAKRIIKKSYHYILSSMMVAIYGQTDKLMLKQMLDEKQVGYYTVALAVCNMWVFVLSAIIDSIYPTIIKCFSENKEQYEKKNRQLYAIVFYLSVFASLGICLVGDWGINLLYGEEYASAGMPLKIITWYTAFSYLGVARNAWIVCEGKQKYLKYIYFCAAILNVILNAVLIPLWGASGAAAASLVTQIFTSLVLPAMIPALRPNAKIMMNAILLRDIT